MSKGKKAGKKGKKELPKRNAKEPAKKEAPKPVESTRSTRGSSKAPLPEKAAQKRKASPSPAPKRTATPAKKTRAASPSPAPLARQGRQSRGASAPAPKVEARQSRTASQKKGEVKPATRVTRAVVEDVESKKVEAKPDNKSRSSSRAKAASTPAKATAAAKKEKETATPKQKETPRGRSSTPRTPAQAPVTPKPKETPRGRSATPKGKQTTTKQKTPTPKAKEPAAKSRSRTPKATPPKQKAATPKQKTVTVKEKTTPKKKSPTPKKVTPPKKATPAKTTPTKTARASPRKSATPTKSEEDLVSEDKNDSPAAKKTEPEPITRTEETEVDKEPEAGDTEAEREIEDATGKEKEETEEIEEEEAEEEREEEAMEVDEEPPKEAKEPEAVSVGEENIENDVADDEVDETIEQETNKAEVPKELEEGDKVLVAEETAQDVEKEEIEATEEDAEDEEVEEEEAAEEKEQEQEPEAERVEEPEAEKVTEESEVALEEQEPEETKEESEAEPVIEQGEEVKEVEQQEEIEEVEQEEEVEEVEQEEIEEVEQQEKIEEVEQQEEVEEVEQEEEVEEEEDQEDLLQAAEPGEAQSEVTEDITAQVTEAALEQVKSDSMMMLEKDELEKASVVAQADETEQMEELVAGLGDGESDIISTEDGSVRESVDENGSGDTGDTSKFDVEEVQYQEAVQEVPQTGYPVVEVPDGDDVAYSEVNTTGIEIAQEVSEASGASGDMVNDVEDVMPIQIDEAAASISNGEQPSLKRKHDEIEEEEEHHSPKKVRLSTDLEYTEEPVTNGEGSAESEDITKEYVVIDMGDVPPSESQEVVDSVPKETVQNYTSEEAVVNEQQTLDQIETNITQTNPVYNRVFIPNPKFEGAVDTSKQFSIVSYNVLADCHLFRNDYSFTESGYLEPDYRLNKLVEEIQYLDGDVVCLQEVDPDFFQDQLLPSMRSFGYEGFHKKRTEEFFDEGEATFFKTDRFTLVDVSTYRVADLVEKEFVDGMDPSIQAAVREYMNRSDVLVVARLQCNQTGLEVTVGNIHVTWGEMKVPDVQSLQIACAIKEVVSKAGSEACPHIMCGDFNSEPFSPGYLMAKDGYLSDEGTITKLQQIANLQLPDGRAESLVNCMWQAFQHTSSSLKSVYFETQGAEPVITSYNRVMCACVDYMFYSSSSLDAVGVLETASKDRIMETGGTPNCYFPSDHVSIKAVFSFK